MMKSIYGNLAVSGIKKNRKMYFPYILTCMGAVMISYIILFLATSPIIADFKSGETIQRILTFGFYVVCIFSVIFLFYTNSFLIRRRKKEIGLYNVLGLGKRHLSVVLFLETLIIAATVLVGGLFFGILFSKLAELCMIKMVRETATFTFSISVGSIINVVIVFLVIFGLIYLNTLRQIHLTKPIELLHSENAGEKPPKANWVIAILGVLLLAVAYYIAVTVENPIRALQMFVLAVVLVVIATYMLFIAGSVVFCKLLQKNKRYYYKTNHFVSVSSMVYRMKRNGAGLASICILCTMILVMISTTVCFYVGAEDSLLKEYPRQIKLNTMVYDFSHGKNIEAVHKLADEVIAQKGYKQSNKVTYTVISFSGIVDGEKIDMADLETMSNTDANHVHQICIFPLSDYNTLTYQNETLSDGQVILYTNDKKYHENKISLSGMDYEVVKYATQFEKYSLSSTDIPFIYVFTDDSDKILKTLQPIITETENQIYVNYNYAFDLNCNDEEQTAVCYQIQQKLNDEFNNNTEDDIYIPTIVQDRATAHSNFYALYGGLLFLGVMLGIVFILAAILIIYYKQISEGYEDQSRFDIMKKVGMTAKEIKQSINSQILTVFFMPILAAGVHFLFAFPFIKKILEIFSVTNTPLLITTSIACYVLFGLLYLIIYRVTSKSYFSIVNDMKNDNK